MNQLSLSYALSDQTFERTKSLGILNLSCQLAEALAASGRLEHFTLLSNRFLASRVELPRDTETLHFDTAADSGWGRMMWDQWRCYSEARRTGNEWLFLPKGFCSFVRRPPMKLAAYVHDTIHDYYARRFPDAVGGFEHRYFVRSFVATLRHADVIFTNTGFTRSEVLRLAANLGIPAPRTHVAGIGFSARVPVATEAKADVLVVIVGRWPHKRSDLAVGWMQRWREQSKFAGEIHLVGALPDGVVVPVGGTWRLHARLDDAGLHTLLHRARAVVYFSEYEGFGMPPVEAALAGACPIFSSVAATREVMGDAGFPFANDDFESFRAAMEGALSARAETVTAWGRRLLAEHSWDKVVPRVIEGLQGADANDPRPTLTADPSP